MTATLDDEVAELRRANAELQQRLDEALARESATAQVLGVINSSPGELMPVFEVMLEKVLSLCDGAFGGLWTYDGEQVVPQALRGVSAEMADFYSKPFRPTPVGWLSSLIDGAPFVHVSDILHDPNYTAGRAAVHALVDLGNFRSTVMVPLRNDGAFVGVICIYGREPRPFTDKQIALLQNFAAQAVIAMENGRLLNETRDRTRDLQESLEYQTATSEVLKIISQSHADLKNVLQTALDTAARLCEAGWGNIFLRRGNRLELMASKGVSVENRADMEANLVPVDRHSTSGRAVLNGQVVHIADIAQDPDYAHASTRAAGVRTMLGVPLLRDNVPIGSISLARNTVQPFTEKQVQLVATFADQAVIAMENARLLGELRHSTEEVAELNRGLEARVAEQVEELGRVGRLKRFLAPQLAELIVSQGDENILEAHRREIVVVFCDLRGYTAFTETAEPEEVLDFLREYHGALGPLVAEYEGTLDQFSGDGIMVFFNDSMPIPDPAERAVKMAMAMREAAGTLIAEWRERGRDLGFGAGIAQGYATLGQIGFADRSGYTAIGTVCNVAARLCAEAKDSQILLSQRVNVALKGSVATEQIGALTLKGLTQPVVTCNVPLTASKPALRVIENGPQTV
jgi:adenylate cyclase